MKTKISIAEFNLLSEVSPIVDGKDVSKKKEIKFKLLDGLQEALSDKWYNMKKGSQEALQYLCMRSTEQGFCFCSPAHLSKKFKIGVSTVYNNLKELIEAKKIVRINRTSTKHNGKGNAVYIFVNHPNFPIICGLLKLDWKANCKADCKAESEEKPCGSKVESDNSASTYSLPTTLPIDLKDNVKHYNVQENQKVEAYEGENDIEKILREKIKAFEEQKAQSSYKKPSAKWYKYVPKVINEKFGFYGEVLTHLWRKIKLAERKVNVVGLTDNDKLYMAEIVLNNLKKHPRFKIMTLDEMCAYVYKGQLNGLFNLKANENLDGMFIDEFYEYYAYVDSYGNHYPTTTDDFIVSCETFSGNMVNWLEPEFCVE